MMPVLALDFDGVLCDSVDETGVTGWRAGGTIWPDMAAAWPPTEVAARFRQARPVIETGYEAILLMRLLLDGERPEILLATYPALAPSVIARSGCDIAALKALFGAARDHWLVATPDAWVTASPLYPGVADWLRATGTAERYILTTKEGRFVERLLAGHAVPFPAERIFGLEQGRSKEAVLRELAERHPGQAVCFVEDRLATLKRCQAYPGLGSRLALRLAGWGYNTEAERREARRSSIPVIERADLFRFFDQESHLDQ